MSVPIDPRVAAGGGKPGLVAFMILAVDEAKIQGSLRFQIQMFHRLEIRIVAAILDRVCDEHTYRLGAERRGLGAGSVQELRRRDVVRRNAPRLQIYRVVQTARRAAASIGKGLDGGVALHADLVAQVDRRGLGEGGLLVAHHIRTQTA